MADKTLLDDAIAAMDELLDSIIESDCEDNCVAVHPGGWRKFIDAHARLLFEQKSAKTETCDEDVVEIFELMQKWHQSKINTMNKILDTPSDTKIVLEVRGEDGRVTLNADQALAYRAAIVFCIELFGKFPLKIEASQPEEDEED